MPKRLTCLVCRLRKYSASAGSFFSSSGRILVQNSGSSMSSSLSSAMKAALEKTEPEPESSPPYVTLVEEDSRISSMSASENCLKRASPSPPSSMKMLYAPRFSIASISARSCVGPAGFAPPRPSVKPSAARSAFMARSRPSLRLARSTISASYVLRVTRRKTLTRLVCPIRCERAIACTSFCGFQSESIRMQVSAAVRLIPSPPARVESIKRNLLEPGALYASIAASRSSPLVEPSIRQYSQAR
mmetsp:Transcript_39162/g.126660  ORF Transcript_39162/g.126660 Transcript_39162/m.126660 type:complete len:245 (-) Transcript_39162:37-771(-)